MPSEQPSPQAWTDAQACWESFVQYPTYIHPDTAVRAIATALDAARNEGRREREGEIVVWLRDDAQAHDNEAPVESVPCWPAIALRQAANEIKRGAGRKENDRG